MSTSPRVEKLEKQEPPKRTNFVAFKAWLRDRNWERVTGRNGALRAAAVTGTLGLVLAFWLLGSWVYRSNRSQTDGVPSTPLAGIPSELPPLTEPVPSLKVELAEPEPDQVFVKPIIASISPDPSPRQPLQVAVQQPNPPEVVMETTAKETVPEVSPEADALPNPPPHAQPRRVGAPAAAPAGLNDPFELEPQSPVEAKAAPAPAQPQDPDVFEKLLVLQKPAPARPVVEKTVDEKPITEKPIDDKVDAEPVEPVVPIEEKPRIVTDKSATPPSREEESFGTQENRVQIERGTTIVPTAGTPETPPAADVETPPAMPVKPAAPPAPPADELPIRSDAEPPADEVKKPSEEAPPAIKAEKVEESTLRDDEPFGSSAPEKPSKPLTESAPPAISEKSGDDKPAPAQPTVIDPEPATKPSPFAEEPPANTRPAPPKTEEEPEIANLPEKREPRPAPPAPVRIPRKPPETTAPLAKPAENPPADTDSQKQPDPPRALATTNIPLAFPQIDFELIAPLQAKRSSTFAIGFKVTNIGANEIDGLVFRIRLPKSLRHRAGNDLEYRIDRLAAGQSHSAQLNVVAESVEMALIHTEMSAGPYRLATSERQINVHGSSTTGFIQRTSAVVPASPQAPRVFPWVMPLGNFDCECNGF